MEKKIIDKSVLDAEVSSVSNMIKFKTLKKPYLQSVNIKSNLLEIDVYLDCKLTLIDSNWNHMEITNENVCHYFNVYLKDNTQVRLAWNLKQIKKFLILIFQDNWNLRSKILIFEHDLQRSQEKLLKKEYRFQI